MYLIRSAMSSTLNGPNVKATLRVAMCACENGWCFRFEKEEICHIYRNLIFLTIMQQLPLSEACAHNTTQYIKPYRV